MAGRDAVKRARVWVSWSTGKESAFALHLAQGEPRTKVAGLFTTVDEDAGTIAYNGVPLHLAHAQAAVLALPLHLLRVPAGCSPRDREVLRRDVLAREAVPAGITAIIFGDAAGTDVRASRAARLAGLGIDAAFPLWGIGTRRLSHAILAAGIRAVITRVDPSVLGTGWAGRFFDEDFIAALGPGVDPCGENGEFHTFTSDSPDFTQPVPVGLERIVQRRDGSVYAELAAAASSEGLERRQA